MVEKKPWVQSILAGQGAGSIRSPLWKGGGVAFGPEAEGLFILYPKKAKKQALISALASKVKKMMRW